MSRNIEGGLLEPDGSGWRARIGVLSPDDDIVPESEFWTMAPDGVSVHVARVPLGDVRTFSDPPGPDNATELLARLPLHSIVFSLHDNQLSTRYEWRTGTEGSS
jgi:maleate isomerase